jgi:hypothetical protein
MNQLIEDGNRGAFGFGILLSVLLSISAGDSNTYPPDQELGALTTGLASRVKLFGFRQASLHHVF